MATTNIATNINICNSIFSGHRRTAGSQPATRKLSTPRPKKGTAQLPFLRRPAQTRLNRVVLDVSNCLIKMLLVADKSVEILRTPKSPTAAEYTIGILRRERFYRMHYFRESVSLVGCEKHMHMIRHDHPAIQPVFFSGEFVQCFHDTKSDRVVFQMGRSPSLVQEFINLAMVFDLGYQLSFAFERVAIDDLLRQRIGKAERAELYYPAAIVVRKVAAVVSEFWPLGVV